MIGVYSLYELVWFFFAYSFLGWCLEVCYCSVNTGHFVNRGFLNGPVCPIYGFGMVLVLALLMPVNDNLILLFLGGMVLASALEFVGGWALKQLFHTSWWDYSDQPFNLKGYICLKFSLAWGFCVVFVMRVIHPAVAALVEGITTVALGAAGVIFGAVIATAFLCDLIVTVLALAKIERDLGAIDQVAQMLQAGSETISERLGNTALALDESMDESRPALRARVDLLRAQIVDNRHFVEQRLLRAFPRMKHTRYPRSVEIVRAWLNEKSKK